MYFLEVYSIGFFLLIALPNCDIWRFREGLICRKYFLNFLDFVITLITGIIGKTFITDTIGIIIVIGILVIIGV